MQDSTYLQVQKSEQKSDTVIADFTSVFKTEKPKPKPKRTKAGLRFADKNAIEIKPLWSSPSKIDTSTCHSVLDTESMITPSDVNP